MNNSAIDDMIKRANPVPSDYPTPMHRSVDAITASSDRVGRSRWLLLMAGTVAVAATVTLIGVSLPSQPTAVATLPSALVFEEMPSKAAGQKVVSATIGRVNALAETEKPATQEVSITTWYMHMREGENDSIIAEPSPANNYTVQMTPKVGVQQMNSDGLQPLTSIWNPDQPVPTNPVALMEFLKIGHPIKAKNSTELLASVRDLYAERIPNPQARASIIQLLSQRPDVTLTTTSDRYNRKGLAFAVTSRASGLLSTDTLIFDPSTGNLLAREELLIDPDSDIDVDLPAVLAYETYRTN